MPDYPNIEQNFSKKHSSSRRWKHRLRRNKGVGQSTRRRTLKQAFRDHRTKKKSRDPSVQKHYSIRRWKNKSRKSMRNFGSGGELTATGDNSSSSTDCDSQPAFAPRIHYREQASTESLLLMSQAAVPGLNEHRFVSLQFGPSATEISRSQSAPISSRNRNIERIDVKSTSLPRTFKNEQVDASGVHRKPVEEQQFGTTSTSVTSSTIGETKAIDSKTLSNSSGSGVMKKIEASVLSFFSFAIPKYNSGPVSGNTSDGGLSLPFFRGKNTACKEQISLKNSKEYVDYSIYGSQGKYFI